MTNDDPIEQLAREILAAQLVALGLPPDTRFFHGGFPGLGVGDRILPPSTTSTPYTLLEYGTAAVARNDRVYVATRPEDALAFACMYPGGGSLYEVEPALPITPDPDCAEPGLSWEAPFAVVLRVAASRVSLF